EPHPSPPLHAKPNFPSAYRVARLLSRRPTGSSAHRAPRRPSPTDSWSATHSLSHHQLLQNGRTHPLPTLHAPSRLNLPTPQRLVPLGQVHSIPIAPSLARGLVQSIFSAAAARRFADHSEPHPLRPLR